MRSGSESGEARESGSLATAVPQLRCRDCGESGEARESGSLATALPQLRCRDCGVATAVLIKSCSHLINWSF